jgi:CubicO group peptidase (beta-lactamase class C family)
MIVLRAVHSCPRERSGGAARFGTHFFVDPQERIVGILMAQTPDQQVRLDFENAIRHAIVGNGTLSGTH